MTLSFRVKKCRGIGLVALSTLILLLAAGCDQANSAAGSGRSTPAQGTGLPRLVDLGADQCIPCKMMAPILDQMEKDYAGRMEVIFIDVWKKQEEARRYGVQVIPTQIFYGADDRELHRHVGFIGKEEILATWKKLGYDFGKP